MKVVKKQIINPNITSYTLPTDAQVLTVLAEIDDIVMFYETDPTTLTTETREFQAVATDVALIDPATSPNYLGTAPLHSGALEMHVYEVQSPPLP